MKASTLNELKKELQTLPPEQVIELCIRLGKYKKDNKELLTYLLFESIDEEAFITNVKAEIDAGFAEMNKSTLYFAKKSIRKILRFVTKYIRYSGSKQTAAELLIYFCKTLKESGIPIEGSTAMVNLYHAQIKKINTALEDMHEDLQYDYRKMLEEIN